MKILYCAFLRGINVNGRNIKMAELCNVFREEEMSDVQSVLASGNVIFSSLEHKGVFHSKLEKAISKHFQFEANLFILSMNEISTLLANNPFPLNPDFHIYCFICEPRFEHILLSEFLKLLPLEDEEALISNDFFYWKVRKKHTLTSSFSHLLSNKHCRSKFTSRNINTIQKVYNKMIIS